MSDRTCGARIVLTIYKLIWIMIAVSIPAMPMTAVAILAVTAILVIACAIRRRHVKASLSSGITYAILIVVGVGVLWSAAVSSVGLGWSITGLEGSADLVGTGASVQRALGNLSAGGILFSSPASVWSAIAACTFAVAATWLSMTFALRRRAVALKATLKK